jgi:nucleoside-diphosphate-sugar epimerase
MNSLQQTTKWEIKMKAIVTGGAGFIGHHLVSHLVNNGWYVHIIDNLSTGTINNLNSISKDKFKLHTIDLSVDVIPEIKGIDVIYHLAAPVSVEESLGNPGKYKNGIVKAAQNLIDGACKTKVSSFIAASTAAVYGEPTLVPIKETSDKNPLSPYAKFKLEMEQIMDKNHSIDLKCTALRFFNVFGEGQRNSGGYVSAVPIFIDQYKVSRPITVTGSGQQTRDWVYVKDVAKAMVHMYAEPYRSKMPIYNIGTGKETKVIDLARSFDCEILHIEPRNEPLRSVANIDNVRSMTNWNPTTNLLDWIKGLK